LFIGHEDGKLAVLSMKNFTSPICKNLNLWLFLTLIDGLKAHQADFTIMKSMKNGNEFLSASKDRSFKIWKIPKYWERTEDLDENGDGNDLEGTEYHYKNVELLEKNDSDHEESSNTEYKRPKSVSSSDSSDDSDTDSSSDSEEDENEFGRT
jgi:hypothetical protein